MYNEMINNVVAKKNALCVPKCKTDGDIKMFKFYINLESHASS